MIDDCSMSKEVQDLKDYMYGLYKSRLRSLKTVILVNEYYNYFFNTLRINIQYLHYPKHINEYLFSYPAGFSSNTVCSKYRGK